LGAGARKRAGDARPMPLVEPVNDAGLPSTGLPFVVWGMQAEIGDAGFPITRVSAQHHGGTYGRQSVLFAP